MEEVVYKTTTQDHSSSPLRNQKTSCRFLYFCAATGNLLAFSAGTAFGWTSPVLPQLAKNDTSPLDAPITEFQVSWVAGLLCLGGILGPLVAGWLADSLGRKWTLLLISLPMLVSYILLAFARKLIIFYIARFLGGFGVGSTFTILPIFTAEIAEDHNRGTLGCFMGVFISLGLLFSFAVGPFLPIKHFCLVCTLPILIFLPIFFLWVPESPAYLAAKNKNGLKRSLMLLRKRTSEQIQSEVELMLKNVSQENKTEVSSIVKVRALRRGLMITLGLMCSQQLAGVNAVLAYMQNIFSSTGSSLAPETCTIFIGIVQLLTTIATSSLVEKLGRRMLLLSSTIGSGLALFSLGSYFYLRDHGFQTGHIFWLPVASLVLYIITFNVGLGPLPFAVMAELFPPHIASIAATISTFLNFCLGFLVMILFPSLVQVMGNAKAFWIFGFVCILATVFILKMLPETKGKSGQEIQRLLEG